MSEETMIWGSALESCKSCDASVFGVIFFHRATIRASTSNDIRERENYARRSAFGK